MLYKHIKGERVEVYRMKVISRLEKTRERIKEEIKKYKGTDDIFIERVKERGVVELINEYNGKEDLLRRIHRLIIDYKGLENYSFLRFSDFFEMSEMKDYVNDYIILYADEICFYNLLRSTSKGEYKLSEDMIRKMKDKLSWSSWSYFSESYEFDEDFIEEHKRHFDWMYIYDHYEKGNISKEFIREHKSYIEWDIISYSNYKVAEDDDFLRSFSDLIDWYHIYDQFEDYLSEEIKTEFRRVE